MSGHFVVTGCAGFIGSHVTDRLLADGHTVTGIDSFQDYYARTTKETNLASARAQDGFRLVEGDLVRLAAEAEPGGSAVTSGASGSTLAAILEGCAGVYHLAGQPGVRGSWGGTFDVYARNNVLATQQLLEACVVAGVPRVVYASSSSVYGDQLELPLRETMLPRPHSPYGVTKLGAEHLCGLYAREHGLSVTSLRLFSVYGPRQRPDMGFSRFIRALRDGDEIAVYGDGTQTRDFTYVGDIVEGLVAAAAPARGEASVFNLGAGRSVSLGDAIEVLADALGEVTRVRYEAAQAGDVRDTLADVTAARSAFGYAPRTSLEEGLAAQAAWTSERG